MHFECSPDWISQLKLYKCDQDVLLSGKELTGSLINAAQLLLSKQYPSVAGFQDTNLGTYLKFSKVNGLQIFHIGMIFIAICVKCGTSNILRVHDCVKCHFSARTSFVCVCVVAKFSFSMLYICSYTALSM